jgi:hypothetical protein
MTDEISPRLALPLLAGGQMQKHVTVNEALCRLDALVQIAVVSRSVTEQPSEPEEAQAWILPDGATGAAWGPMAAGVLAVRRDGGWLGIQAPLGTIAFVADEDQIVVRLADGWTPLGALLSRVEGLHGLGIGTAPDGTNRFAARLNAALLVARPEAEGGTGDVRLSLSKAAPGDVASVVFQTAFGGRAEIGLAGDDAFAVRVSADGGTWREALKVDPDAGRVLFAEGALRREATVLTASGSYAPPAWARSLRVTLLGGGGGGAGGQGGLAATPRLGGGGGGAGGRTECVWATTDLGAELTIVVGPGGSGGAPGSDGGAGGTTTVSLVGQVLASALGGSGGQADGDPGAGGAAFHAGNAGGQSNTAGAGGAGEHATDPAGPGGGGAGGAVTAADTALAGGSGGWGALCGRIAPGGSGGSSAGSDGTSSTAPTLSPAGGGGAGGGGSSIAPGHDGGDAGDWGAGGGGGLTTGGAGGAGAPGLVVVVAEG